VSGACSTHGKLQNFHRTVVGNLKGRLRLFGVKLYSVVGCREDDNEPLVSVKVGVFVAWLSDC
jgi:hypothetical protein